MKQAEFLPAKAPDLTGVSRSLRGGLGELPAVWGAFGASPSAPRDDPQGWPWDSAQRAALLPKLTADPHTNTPLSQKSGPQM